MKSHPRTRVRRRCARFSRRLGLLSPSHRCISLLLRADLGRPVESQPDRRECVQYRGRLQAAVPACNRLPTRAVLRRSEPSHRKGQRKVLWPFVFIVVEIVDSGEKIATLLPFIDEMIEEGLVTLEDIRVIQYRSARAT